MSEKAVTVPVSWMQDKEKQNHPCVQLSTKQMASYNLVAINGHGYNQVGQVRAKF